MVPGVGPVVVGALAAALCVGRADAPAADPCAVAYVRVVMTGVERSTDVQALDEGRRPGRMLTEAGQSTDPVFSPDGRQLAFISGAGYDRSFEHGNDRQSLYVMDLGDMDLGDSQVRRLSSDHLDARPAWSSDGGQIAIIRRPAGRHERQVAWGAGDELLVAAWREDGIAGSDGGTQPPQILSARWPQPLGTGPVSANPWCRALG